MRRFYCTLVLSLLVLSMASLAIVTGVETRRSLVISFSSQCLNSSGGAVLHLGATTPTASATFAITNVLETLNGWTEADLLLPDRTLVENISAWVKSLQKITDSADYWNYGGFIPQPNGGNATLQATYHGVMTLSILNESTSSGWDHTLALNFTANLQRLNATQYPETVGGFANTPTTIATLASTFQALEILSTYNQLNRMNMTLATSWIESLLILDPANGVNYGGFINSWNASIADLQSTYMGLQSRQILGLSSYDSVVQNAITDFILSCYHADPNYPQYFGGFGYTPDEIVSTHLATFYAIAALDILDKTTQLAIDDIVSWILSTQTTNGGFAEAAGLNGFAPQTHRAVASLALLDKLDALQESIGIDPFIFPWWVIAVAVVIIFVIVCIFLGRRQEWF